jgi:hypothetical protein
MTGIFKAILAATALAACWFDADAQKFEPTETCPFLYADFTPGVVRNSNGNLINYSEGLNVSVSDGNLYFLKNKVIMICDMATIVTAKIGEDIYLNAGGKMMRLLAENENGAVVLDTSIDEEKMSRSDIGYGISSATASTQNVNTLSSLSSVLVNVNIQDILDRRASGAVLPLAEKRYLRVGLIVVPASKKSVMELPFVDKDEAKAFFKSAKIKWSDVDSLLKVVDFITEQNKK